MPVLAGKRGTFRGLPLKSSVLIVCVQQLPLNGCILVLAFCIALSCSIYTFLYAMVICEYLTSGKNQNAIITCLSRSTFYEAVQAAPITDRSHQSKMDARQRRPNGVQMLAQNHLLDKIIVPRMSSFNDRQSKVELKIHKEQRERKRCSNVVCSLCAPFEKL